MITISNIFNNDNQRYFGCKIAKGHPDIEKIKALPKRWWNNHLCLWLIPYSKENWLALQTIFKQHIQVDANCKHVNISLYSNKNIVKSNSLPQNNKNGVFKPLSEIHQIALLKMKEQLIVKRYQFNTQKNYLSSFTEFLCYFHDINPSAIGKEDIKNFLLHKINIDGISESTQNCHVNAIKFYYEKVEKWEKFYINDLRPRMPYQLPEFLSKEECERLLNTPTNQKHRLILQLMYSSGMRLGEVVHLKIKEINFDNKTIFIRGAKGKKDRYTILSSKVAVKIKEYIDSFKPTYWLIEGQHGGQYSRRSVQKIMEKAVEKSKVNPDATPHMLRHSFATHLILAGVDIRIVQEYLGHNSIKTTEIYTHITDQMKSQIKSPIDDLDI